MSWFTELAGKAETLLNNIDEQTGAALRSHNAMKSKKYDNASRTDNSRTQNKRPPLWAPKKIHFEKDRSPSPIKKRIVIPNAYIGDNRAQEQVKMKSPVRKSNMVNSSPISPRFSGIENKPNDWSMDQYGVRRRRNTFSGDVSSLHMDNVYKMQNLEVENAMLKNEINVMNRELSDLMDRLRKTEDDLNHYKSSPMNEGLDARNLKVDNEMLRSQLDQLKQKVVDLSTSDVKNKEHNHELEAEAIELRSANRQLEEKYKILNEELSKKELAISKVENELRHAQGVISEQQGSLEKSTSECRRLEKDWVSYKLRVKSMLFSKDEEIKKLREGSNLAEDTKQLIEQMKVLKEERDDLSEQISKVKEESEKIKISMGEMVSRNAAVERIVIALRDALKEERSARTRFEMESVSLEKELKAMHVEMGQTIAKLRASLQAKESELNKIRDSQSAPTSDVSSLNVADYDVAQAAMDSERVQHLSQLLVQKQGKVEALLADNNTLRIQLDKLQTKYRTEVSSARAQLHSVVVQESRARYSPADTLAKMSLRIGHMSRRYPILRVFIIFYMIGLHLWVFTVLFTNTPETFTRPSKT
ncbi:Golgin subfamily A member 5 [Papilio xuthus]|uniref:Golgin subfamily A member 5 n=1 Tax=Papilio xuthus TaxID=66420 RepID=A0A194PLE5_PAPXU|nr:Golgin subfamily A member 5 [Papilio xuthus]